MRLSSLLTLNGTFLQKEPNENFQLFTFCRCCWFIKCWDPWSKGLSGNHFHLSVWSTIFKPLSQPNGFYWGHQSLWTFTPANSMQSNDRNRKKPGQMQSLNLLCSTIFGVCFVVPLHCYSAQGLLRAIVAAPLKRPSQAEILQRMSSRKLGFENWAKKKRPNCNNHFVARSFL